MKLECWALGKAHESFVSEGVDLFTRRTGHYFAMSWQIFPPPKTSVSLSRAECLDKEAAPVLAALKPGDHLILLDERGRSLSSEDLSGYLGQRALSGDKRLIFLIGGAYGAAPSLHQRADLCWSLSKLVFPHQLVRLILAEQLYRACTILRNEKYHHP